MPEKYIETEQGIYSYRPKRLRTGVKKLDTAIAFKLLSDVADVLNKHSIDYCLMFGTLLGAVREAGLIPHDEDMDIFIRECDFKKLVNTLFELRVLRIDVVRHSDFFLSVMRDGEYIDFYVFSDTTGANLKCKSYVYPKFYFDEFEVLNLKGKPFNVPKHSDLLLNMIYGDDWRIPKEGKHALTNSKGARIYRFTSKMLERILPGRLFTFLKRIVIMFQ